MSYKLNKTDGSLLVDLVDGQLDTTTTDISLIGKNYSGFGESLNENLIKMLENFSKSSAPSNPLIGQLWYDTATQRIKVYDGVGFRTSGAPSVQPQQPAGMVAGDLWIDSDDKKLYFYDGSQLELAGPIYSTAQGKTGPEVITLIDVFNNSQIVIKWNIAGTTVGVWSNTEFTPAVGYTIAGITGDIKPGFTPVALADFRFRGIADQASALRDSLGNVKSAEKFLPADASATTTGALTVQNSGGLTIGLAQNNILKVVGTSFVSENQLSNHDWKVRVRKPSGFIDALVVSTTNSHFGVFKTDPQYALHVGGDMKVEGNLLIGGDSVFVETQNLRVEDKNIELAIQSDSSTGDNAAVDGGGVILKSSQLDKEFIWKNTTQAWTSSENMDLATTKGYKVDGVEVLNKTAIGSTVTHALGITQVGTLSTLSVDDITLNGNTVSTSASGLQITSTGSIAITNNQKITGLANPTLDQDAATKYYVDDQINDEPVIMNLDISDGITNAQMATIIEDIYPAGNKKVGTFAYITTSTMAGISVTGINIGAVTTKSFISVDSNGVQNESVLQDIAFTNATGTSTPSITRGLKRFIVVGTTWVFNGDLSSSGGLW